MPGRAQARMPWPGVIGTLLVIGLPTGLAGSLDGFQPAGLAQVAAAGAIGGYIGTVFASRWSGAAGLLAAWTAVVLVGGGPWEVWGRIDPRWAVAGLALLAGIEAWRNGGRALTIAIVAAVFLGTAGQAPDPWTAESLLAFGGAGLFGIAGALVFGAEGLQSRPRSTPRQALALTLFLAIGLAMAITLFLHLRTPEATWLMPMFVFRALAPRDNRHLAHLQFAAGAVLGAIIAGMSAHFILAPLELLTTPMVTEVLALAAVMAGLRFVPSRGLVTPFAMSAAAVLVLGPTTGTAIMRGEEAIGVTLLAILLTLALDFLLGRRRGT